MKLRRLQLNITRRKTDANNSRWDDSLPSSTSISGSTSTSSSESNRCFRRKRNRQEKDTGKQPSCLRQETKIEPYSGQVKIVGRKMVFEQFSKSSRQCQIAISKQKAYEIIMLQTLLRLSIPTESEFSIIDTDVIEEPFFNYYSNDYIPSEYIDFVRELFKFASNISYPCTLLFQFCAIIFGIIILCHLPWLIAILFTIGFLKLMLYVVEWVAFIISSNDIEKLIKKQQKKVSVRRMYSLMRAYYNVYSWLLVVDTGVKYLHHKFFNQSYLRQRETAGPTYFLTETQRRIESYSRRNKRNRVSWVVPISERKEWLHDAESSFTSSYDFINNPSSPISSGWLPDDEQSSYNFRVAQKSKPHSKKFRKSSIIYDKFSKKRLVGNNHPIAYQRRTRLQKSSIFSSFSQCNLEKNSHPRM